MGGFYHEGDNDSSPEIQLCSAMERGVSYAEACFETFRIVDGAIFCWPEHIERLRRGLAEFGLTLTDVRLEELKAACRDAAVEYGGHALVRVTVTGGNSGWGLMAEGDAPAIYVQVMPAEGSHAPLSLHLKAWPFVPKLRPAKFTSDYSDTLRALKGEADANVLFTFNDFMLGAATANLLLFRQGQWWTPQFGPGVLPGIVRGHLLAAGLLKEVECPLGWLPECQAVAVSNSGLFVRPVAAISGYATGELKFDAGHAAFRTLLESFAGMDGVPLILPT